LRKRRKTLLFSFSGRDFWAKASSTLQPSGLKSPGVFAVINVAAKAATYKDNATYKANLTEAGMKLAEIFWENRLAHVRVGNILLHHALGIKERSVDGDGVLHNAEITVALVIKHGNDYAVQLGVKRFGISPVVCD
jgi:hypothetical protein